MVRPCADTDIGIGRGRWMDRTGLAGRQMNMTGKVGRQMDRTGRIGTQMERNGRIGRQMDTDGQLSSYAAPLPQRLHYPTLVYCARETEENLRCQHVYSDAADEQPRLQLFPQFTAARLFDTKPFFSSQLQPDDPIISLEQPRRRMSPTWHRVGKPSQHIKCVLRSGGPNWWTQTRDCVAQ